MNSRTILLWHNNGEQQFSFTVNPESLSVSRPNCNRVETLAMGGTVNLWGGRGLREVRFTTFLPGKSSPFYDGTDGAEALALLKGWQDSGDPIRMIVSGSDINDAFLALSAYSAVSAGKEMPLKDAAFLAADTDEDGEVTLDDAFRILSYYSLSAAGREADWETI